MNKDIPDKAVSYEEYLMAKGVVDFCKSSGFPAPEDKLRIVALYDEQQQHIAAEEEKRIAESKNTPIYSALKANARFPISEEKKACIESTVEQLLADSDNALEPGLLLGKIQCGKTDTFENIIGLAFDKGVDIAVVLTKGTKALAEQTIKRMKNDYDLFKENDSIDGHPIIRILDIMKIKNGLHQAQVNNAKIVIVCKKQAKNLEHLINLYTQKSTYLLKKRTIIIDDEADFASRNYGVRVTDADSEDNCLTLAAISQQIDDFREISKARYLQVTATPYALLLQPNGEIPIYGGAAKTFKPRFSQLVPVHEAYIGGKQYFEDAMDSESMYNHLFNEVPQKCMDILKKQDKRYISNATKSNGTFGLTRALMAYLMATAIRVIQQRNLHRIYRSSGLIHVDIAKKKMEWQALLVKALINDIEEFICDRHDSNLRLKNLFEDLYEDFCESNKKGRNTGEFSVGMPSAKDIRKELADIFKRHDYHVQIVNSDKEVSSILNEDTGELKLNATVNIFIGGNILDRGITIQNMLCFFYGRDPKKFQQDTVLQHARMYGARSKEDMAVTRLHTTRDIYDVLVRMNELDNNLRKLIAEGKAGYDITINFVGYDGNIRPCASSKIRASETFSLKPFQRTLPFGFKTGTRTSISRTVDEIDRIIKTYPEFGNKDEAGFFFMDLKTVEEILDLIGTTYRYSDKDDNMAHSDDIRALKSALSYCMDNVADNKVYILYRENRNMNRLRRDNGGFIDAPEDGRTDLAPSKNKAIDRPVVMLFRENGAKTKVYAEWAGREVNIGWSDTPFYWPLLLSQANLTSALYVLHEKKAKCREAIDEERIISGINPEEVLKMSYKGNLEEDFGPEGSDLSGDEIYVTKSIKESTAGNFLLKDENRDLVIRESCGYDESANVGVYTYNRGVFPFVVRPYKYLLLRSVSQSEMEWMLLELEESNTWLTEALADLDKHGNLIDIDSPDTVLISARDIIVEDDLTEREEVNTNVCQWRLHYKVRKVVRHYRELRMEIDGEE